LAAASFAAIYFYHRSGLAPVPDRFRGSAFAGHGLQWFTEGVAPNGLYTMRAMLSAPLLVAGLALSLCGWKHDGIEGPRKIALIGLLLPLITLLFYRNTFPYFFAFIFAPMTVAVAPAIGIIRERFGTVPLSLALTIIPLAAAISEPRDVIARQQALIDYVHSEFPQGSGYLGYSGMAADYPRVINHLTSGIGIQTYHQRGDPVVARAINAGSVPFIIANHAAIAGALIGRPMPETFLPEDVAAMHGNYLPQWGLLWREGKRLPAGEGEFEFELSRGGPFTLDGAPVTLDGKLIGSGVTIHLAPGSHSVSGSRPAAAILWRGKTLPATPPRIESGPLFTNY
jgi:hypothetical protein